MSPPGHDFGFTIDIPMLREWANIDGVRSALQTMVALLFQDVDYRHTLAMVAGELLENAVKYGHWGVSTEPVRMRIWGSIGGEAFVQVSNPVANGESARAACDVIAQIHAAESPAAAYQARLLEISRSSARISRLGLLRVAYEGGCDLRAELVGSTMTVTATVPKCL